MVRLACSGHCWPRLQKKAQLPTRCPHLLSQPDTIAKKAELPLTAAEKPPLKTPTSLPSSQTLWTWQFLEEASAATPGGRRREREGRAGGQLTQQ